MLLVNQMPLLVGQTSLITAHLRYPGGEKARGKSVRSLRQGFREDMQLELELELELVREGE